MQVVSMTQGRPLAIMQNERRSCVTTPARPLLNCTDGSNPSLCAAAVAGDELDGRWRGFTTSATPSTHLLALTQVCRHFGNSLKVTYLAGRYPRISATSMPDISLHSFTCTHTDRLMPHCLVCAWTSEPQQALHVPQQAQHVIQHVA